MSRSITNPVADPAPSQGPTIWQRFVEVRSVFITELSRRLVQRIRARNMDPNEQRSRELVYQTRRLVWSQMGVRLHRAIVRLDHASRMNRLFSLTESMDTLIIDIADGLTNERIDNLIDAMWNDLGFNES